MPENVGGIEYTVGADVSGLLKSEKDVDRATDSMERSFKGTDQSAQSLNSTMGKLPVAVKRANTEIVKATGNTKSLNGAVGQLGFQLQDISVQLQSGTSPFVVLGQQGSQIASIFGPGGAVIGAVIAVASAIGGVFAASAATAADEVEELSVDIEDLIDKIGELTVAQKAYLEATLTRRIADLGAQLRILENEAESLRGTLSAPIRDDDFLKRTSDRLLEVNAQIDGLSGQINEYRSAIKGARDDNEDWNESNDRSADRLDRLIESTRASASAITGERGELEKSARAKAVYVATTLGATEAQLAEIDASFDRIEAYAEEQKALRELAKEERARASQEQAQTREDVGVIEALRKDLATQEQLVFESEQKRREAILRQTEAGSEERRQLLIAASASTSQQLLDIEARRIEAERQMELEAAEERKQRDLEEIQRQAGVNEETASRLQELMAASDNAAESIRSSFTNALIDIGDTFSSTFADAIVEGESLTQSLRSVAQAFLKDVLGALIKLGAQTAINAAIGNTAQASTAAAGAAAGASLAAAYAPAAALASLASFGANAVPAQAGIASTLALSQGAATVPGLQLGGPIGAGQLRRVNENGPELFTDGARQFLLPDRAGNVVSNSDASGTGTPPLNVVFNIENQVQNAGFQVQDVNQTGTEVTIRALIADVNNRGPFFRALQQNSNVTGVANG